jgi:hypothetical protein
VEKALVVVVVVVVVAELKSHSMSHEPTVATHVKMKTQRTKDINLMTIVKLCISQVRDKLLHFSWM